MKKKVRTAFMTALVTLLGPMPVLIQEFASQCFAQTIPVSPDLYSLSLRLSQNSAPTPQPTPPPPPPPSPPPPPPPPQHVPVFLVFFDWGKTDFEPSGAAQVVAQIAVEAWRSEQSSKFIVKGYTDTSEENPEVLSETRAHNLLEYLVSYGIPRDRIIAIGKGDQDLRVPTGPGVHEPQNRRVEITFQGH